MCLQEVTLVLRTAGQFGTVFGVQRSHIPEAHSAVKRDQRNSCLSSNNPKTNKKKKTLMTEEL